VPVDADALEEAASARSARNSSPTHCKQVRCRTASGGTQNAVLNSAMNADLYERSPSVSEAEHWLALGTGALLLIVGASRRSVMGACLATSSVPLLYRGITGRWPNVLNGHLQRDNTDLERFAAKRMGATTVELKSSHVPMLSHPKQVLDVVRSAVVAVQNSAATQGV